MILQFEDAGRRPFDGSRLVQEHWPARRETGKGRVLVVEDEEIIRESLGPLLEEEGYEAFFAENGREALKGLYAGNLPDIIVLDLRMPIMDGWQFRTVQKDDPKLGRIPVLAISADGSAQAAAISAQGYLRKPVDAKEFLTTIQRILVENEWQKTARADETERLASLGRLAAGVGHEINNPLTFVMMNLVQSLERLRPSIRAIGEPLSGSVPVKELEVVRSSLAGVMDMLEDCQVGGERIRQTVKNLQSLSRLGEERRGPVDLHKVIEQSVSMVWTQIRHRARLVKTFGKIPLIPGNEAALGQVFLNLLVNAAQAMPEGNTQANEIRVLTKVEAGENGPELLVEISDSGAGMTPETLAHLFEPFFTTKPLGQGTGLGLSISRQTVRDHGGRMTVKSVLGEGTVFRVYLPAGDSNASPLSVVVPGNQPALLRGRVLVIDDEPLIGRIVRSALASEHDVCVARSGSDAIALLEQDEAFDLILCDVVMPDLNGPQFYGAIAERWPELVTRLVFMTGGAFTPGTVEFLERVPTRVLTKPFKIDRLKRLVRERMRKNTLGNV